MNRRSFIGTLAGGLLVAPLVAEAQPAGKIARIGDLAPNLRGSPQASHEAFVEELRGLGYVEGRNVVIEYRDAEGKESGSPLLRPNWLRSTSMSSWPPQAHSPPWPPGKRLGFCPLSSLRLALR